MHKNFRIILLAGAALSVLTGTAMAQSLPQQPDPRISLLQQQLRDVQAEVDNLKNAASSDNSTALADLKRSTSDQYADLNSRFAALPAVSVDNGRLTVASADGRFTAAIRGLVQFDTGYYSQDLAASKLPASYGSDFSSGSNFRRIYLGLSGKVFGDWTYNMNFDFGGSGGTETPGHVQSVYLEYDGLSPWALRIGAFPPPANLEDSTASGDTIFLERNSPSDLQRNIAGGDGRDAITLLYAAPTVFGAVSVTGDKIGDGAKAFAAAGAVAAPTFGEQQGVVGRLSWLPIAESDAHWLIGVNGTYVIRPPNAVANGVATLATTPGAAARNTISLSDPPELTVDSNGYALASTGALPANHLTQWGVETAGNWGSVYGQAGYYGFNVSRAQTAVTAFTASGVSHTQTVQPSDDNFSAWYVQGTWLLTGESRLYNPSTGAFTPPRVATPLSLNGSGWGAFELAARYSDLNLNSHALDNSSVVTAWSGANETYTFYNTARGGDQRIVTLGLNWYPNNVVRFAVNYELIQSSRLQSPATVTTTGTPVLPTLNGGQNLSAVALRAQVSF